MNAINVSDYYESCVTMPVTGFRSSTVSKYRISAQCCRHRLSPFAHCLVVVLPWVSLDSITAKWNQHGMAYVSIPFSYAGIGFPQLWLSFRRLALLPHTLIFILEPQGAGCAHLLRLLLFCKSDNMLHSPLGFPLRTSWRIIGCFYGLWTLLFSYIRRKLDTFTYRLRVANL